jgi:CHAT domain-containing protein
VAVLADPVFEANDPRVKNKSLAKAETASSLSPLARSLRSFDARAGLARLILSRDEAEAIAAAVPATERLKALDFRASRAEAMSAELSQYRIVHFATHGLLNAERPELSGLVFSLIDEQGQPQDGFLRLHEIYNLQLPAELVVLSACQSGLGKDIRGEGMIGLTRGFMYAGAARVVASLWRVDDYATSVLMKKFYRGMLQEKLPAAAALRKAQVEMWRQQQWQSPFYWGAFVLQGEWK